MSAQKFLSQLYHFYSLEEYLSSVLSVRLQSLLHAHDDSQEYKALFFSLYVGTDCPIAQEAPRDKYLTEYERESQRNLDVSSKS